ncbi:hypothetical protein ANCDUO_17796 [Ancylostoma duodenale]|uniref:DNA2/NAM7 helicase helicase domain-containing protein n=1 Tax=Ancylostoma duodenale TaxID=51022 RepID=A0A0C2FZJ6_9BILA|nr:hypothetical protein ANCDUO_17796 [Ancylostoma duodenale]
MSKLSNAACPARHTHWVIATVRNIATYTMNLEFFLHDMPCKAGWGNQRPLVIWIAEASKLLYANVISVEVHPQHKAFTVSVEAYTWSHDIISRSRVQNRGRYIEGTAFLDVRVHLSRASSLANLVYEFIARVNIYRYLSADSTADAVLRSRDACRDLAVVHYVSDTAATKNLITTPVHINEILENFGNNFAEDEEIVELCQEFKEGREYLEQILFHPERAPVMSDEDRNEYFTSKKFVSENHQKMVNLMFQLFSSSIICPTTASLLNVTASAGIFSKYMTTFHKLIRDEAQKPEPAMAAAAARLPQLRYVYIGDIHQLEPHAKRHRTTIAARFGAPSVMSVLSEAREVLVAPLVTTFLAHLTLIELPNRVAYARALESGLNPEHW